MATFVIALTELPDAWRDPARVDGEIAAVSDLLGMARYDVRQWIGRGLPHVVLRVSSEDDAELIAGALRSRGCGVLACRQDKVVPSAALVQVRAFEVDEGALVASTGAAERMAFADLAALIVVARVSVIERVERERVFSLNRRGDAQKFRESAKREQYVDHAIYLIPRRAPCWWVLHEYQARYAALGPKLRRTTHENFLATLDLLKASAPNAIVDERMWRDPHTSVGSVRHDGSGEPDRLSRADGQLDLRIHVLAQWLLRPRSSPYRVSGRDPDDDAPA